MLMKLIYLVRKKLTLIKLKPCSLSRRINFQDSVRIIEFWFWERGATPQDVVVALHDPKVQVSCHNFESSQIEGYI